MEKATNLLFRALAICTMFSFAAAGRAQEADAFDRHGKRKPE